MFSKKKRPISKASPHPRRLVTAYSWALFAGSLVLGACATDPRSMLPWGTYKYRGASALPREIEPPSRTRSAMPTEMNASDAALSSFRSSETTARDAAYEYGPDALLDDADRIHYPVAVRGIQPPRMALPSDVDFPRETWSDAVVARVNGVPILLSELKEAALDSQLPLTDLQLTGMSGETYRRSITRLVDDRLLVQEARREDIEPDEIEIGRRVDEWLTRVVEGMGGKEHFHRKLKTAGLDAATLRTFMVKRETEKTLAGRIVSSRVTVSSQDVRDFVDARKAEGEAQQQVKLAQIFLRCPESEQQTKAGRNIFYAGVELAREAQAEPHRFAELAREHSEDAITRDSGGLLGWLAPDSMRSYFRDRVIEMREGEVSEPIAGPDGYHILYLAERRTPRDLLYAERFDAERIRLIARLRETGAIEIYPFTDYIDAPARPALPFDPAVNPPFNAPKAPAGTSLARVGSFDAPVR